MSTRKLFSNPSLHKRQISRPKPAPQMKATWIFLAVMLLRTPVRPPAKVVHQIDPKEPNKNLCPHQFKNQKVKVKKEVRPLWRHGGVGCLQILKTYLNPRADPNQATTLETEILNKSSKTRVRAHKVLKTEILIVLARETLKDSTQCSWKKTTKPSLNYRRPRPFQTATTQWAMKARPISRKRRKCRLKV